MCLSPIFRVTGQLGQVHPFSSVMHPLLPIGGKQYPPFSPHSTQDGQLGQIHICRTIFFLCSISSGLICIPSISSPPHFRPSGWPPIAEKVLQTSQGTDEAHLNKVRSRGAHLDFGREVFYSGGKLDFRCGGRNPVEGQAPQENLHRTFPEIPPSTVILRTGNSR